MNFLPTLRTLPKQFFNWNYVLLFFSTTFLFFLPYSYALTIRLGFPLKISEITLILYTTWWLFFIFYNKRYPAIFKERSIKIYLILLLSFFTFALTSFFINTQWQYSYHSPQIAYRYTPSIDSLLKSLYILVIIMASLISYMAFSCHQKHYYLKVLNVGAISSAIYAWYLFVFGLYEWDVYLLPGMDSWPQHGLFSFGHFIRCGTFKEGNYAGLFFLTVSAINIYQKKYFFGVLIILGAVPTFSSMVLLGLISFICTLAIYKIIALKKYLYIFVLFIPIITYIPLSQNKDFNFLVSKFFTTENEKFEDAQNSKNERVNLSKAALNIGLDNPFFGVGLSNYSYHFPHYNPSETINHRANFKYIPNNIYLEIFSELGTIGLLIFVLILIFFLIQSLIDKTGVLFSAYIMYLIYFIAFPTFSILFVWVFFGLLLTLKK